MSRESFGAYIECKTCGAGGTAGFTEREDPAHARGDLDTQPEEAPKGFRVVGKTIICKKCKTVAWPSN